MEMLRRLSRWNWAPFFDRASGLVVPLPAPWPCPPLCAGAELLDAVLEEGQYSEHQLASC